MTEFVENTLGEVCEDSGGIIQTGPFGSQLHQSDYSETGIPVVMPADIKNGRIDETRVARVSEGHVERLKRHKLEVGDIVYGRRGDIGRQAIIRSENEGWLCGTGCLRLSLGENPRILPEYLHLYLSMPEVIGWIQNQAIGATMPNLNTQILKRVPLIFPEDFDAQKKIVAIVGAYDDLIENNKRRITLLENMAEEIYCEWFVRFRLPGWQQAEFEKGLPAGWSIKRLNDILVLQYGKALKSEDRVEGTVPVYGSSGVVGFHNEALVERPGIIVGRKGNVGAIHWSDVAFYPIDTVYYVVSDLSKHFLYYLLHSVNFINNDAAVPGLNRKQAYSNEVLVPKSGLIEQFEELVKPLYDQKRSLIKMNDNLEKTKNQLLPRLISGKLSVENLDIQFPPSMQSDESDSADEAAA
tara:strand:+ start:373 stop:1605 length:1233 start_codon:yes stop_codon:yes gene_type:complete